MRWIEAPGPGAPTPSPDGPAVVLLHGIPTSAELWRHVVPILDDVRVLAWELVGYGASIPAGRGRDISVAHQAAYLMEFLEAIGIRRAVLVGHDLGGGVAQIAALRRPSLCAGLVLTNAVAYDSWPVLPMRALRASGAVLARVPLPVWRQVFHSVIAAMHDDPARGRESARIHWAHYARYGGAEALVRQARSLDVQDTLAVQDRLEEIEAPARVVWGDRDRFQPMAYGARLARDLGTSVRALPGAGHFTPEDHPEPIAAAIRDVLGPR